MVNPNNSSSNIGSMADENMRKLSIILLTGIILTSCSLFDSGYRPSEYISTTGIANPDSETKIELEDGASITIPANSINAPVTVKVERNPQKVSSLPSLSEKLTKVSDFYNFEIIEGQLIGPVELTMPIDANSIPEGDGILIAAFPTETGWEYVPVDLDGDQVTIYTDQVGDPIIAWHFSELENEDHTTCDPNIILDVVPVAEGFQVDGQVIPARNSLSFNLGHKPASNLSVEIILNRGWRGEGQGFSVTTNDNGSFSFTIDQSQGLAEGWNWIFAKAKCDPWFLDIAVESKGYAEFKYSIPVVIEETSDSQPTEPPIVEQPTETPIPTGAVLIPDFTGKTFTEATEWLGANGFKYTWIGGGSPYGLGAVYSQAPAGGEYKVPHRTVVVLYRTTEQVEDAYGCTNPKLSPEQKSNCGTHEYLYSCTVTKEYGKGHCLCDNDEKSYSGNLTLTITFSDNTVELLDNTHERIGLNSYKTTYRTGENQQTVRHTTFIETGILIIDDWQCDNGACSCQWSIDLELIK